jgi:hypothetical protein
MQGLDEIRSPAAEADAFYQQGIGGKRGQDYFHNDVILTIWGKLRRQEPFLIKEGKRRNSRDGVVFPRANWTLRPFSEA